MKRFLAVFVSFILLLTSLSVGLVVVAENLTQESESELETFANELFALIREHDNDSYSDSSSVENEEFEDLDEITEYYPITYAEQLYSSVNPIAEADSEIYEHIDSLPENAFELNRLIVKSKNPIDYHGAIDLVSGYKDLYVLQYDSLDATIEAYVYYLSLDEIEYVEPDLVHHTQEAPEERVINSDDVELDIELDSDIEIVEKIKSWNIKDIGFDKVKEKLSEIELPKIVVAVLDSGVDTDHELLEGRLVENFVNCSDTGSENSVEDDYGHGTHVAGIIVEGTPDNVKIKPYKVLNSEGKGSLSTISVALDLAAADGVDIINMSLTAEGESQTMTDSVNAAVEKGVNVVVAAGNKGVNLNKKTYSPACIDSAITVSAVNQNHSLSSYSNYGDPIDIAAPGDNIVSSYLDNTYTSMNGTSMAAPQVCAALAIVRSVHEDLTNSEVEEFVEEYATKMEDEEVNKYGAGILYAKHLLEENPRTVDPIFNVQSGEFVNSFSLTIKCYEKNSKIYYILIEEDFDGELDDENIEFNILEANEYNSFINISKDTTVAAIAVSEDKLPSDIVVMEYDRKATSEEDLYDINRGLITGYYGIETDIVIPDKIRGEIVKGIDSHAFEDNQSIRSVVLAKNITLISISAFENCQNLESVTGGRVKNIYKNAFKNSSIAEFSFENVESIDDYAFYNCTNLKNVSLPKAEDIGMYAFANVPSFEPLNCENLTEIGSYAFKGAGVTSVSLPLLDTLGLNAFEDCTQLTSVSMPNIVYIPNNAFKKCTSLSQIELPNITAIGNYAFQGATFNSFNFEKVEAVGNYAFRDNTLLEYALLPIADSVGTGSFYGCTNLKLAYLPALEELESNTFARCSSLKSVWLPSAENINKNAFLNSSIEHIQLDSVKTIESLPNTLTGLILSSSFEEVTCALPLTDFTVYGYENTAAYDFAQANSKEFVEVPVLYYAMPESVSLEQQYLIAYSIGFNCSYQWYKNDIVSNENGTLIEGATSFWYEPSLSDDAACYYCVIVSDDGVNRTEITTTPVSNIPQYRKADYTEYDSVVEEVANIDRTIYTEDSLVMLDALMSQDVSGYTQAEQDLLTAKIEEIKAAISSLVLKYILGDINSDGKISLIDARLALQNVSGTESFTELQLLAADVNKDDKISLIDVRIILTAVSNSQDKIE